MNKEITEKNLAYQSEINEIAKMIFHAFYFDEQISLSYPPDSNHYEKDSLQELLPKAEKIHKFFNSLEESKNCLKFMHEINQIKGAEFISSL